MSTIIQTEIIVCLVTAKSIFHYAASFSYLVLTIVVLLISGVPQEQ